MDFKHTNLTVENELPKLVRDNIIQQIKADGNDSLHFHIATTDQEYDLFLKKKLIEESTEASSAVDTEELTKEISDVLEIIDSLKKLHHINDEQLQQTKELKKSKNGGFDKRHILDSK